MEPQIRDCYYEESKEKCNKKKNCLGIIAIILLTAFSVVIGLLVGAAIASSILSALSAIIVLAIILGLLLLLTIIYILCNRKKKYKCC